MKLSKPILCGLMVLTCPAYAAASENPPVSDPEFDELLSLDIADLSVTSVAQRAQKLSETAAAIYVITQEDLRRAGAISIPEALRLVPGVQVAKIASNRWAVTARGFNGALANKLLVLLDGRAIYTPTYGGTYWDDQSTLVEDIDRIEVIRGPGASLYGSNAVNGVINIITKTAQDTQGNLISLTGSTRGGLAEARHGGQLGNDIFYRVYATYLDIGKTEQPNHASNFDAWNRARTGFRMDTSRIGANSYTLQGDFYTGNQDAQVPEALPAAPYSINARTENDSFGGNVLGRWTHYLGHGDQLTLQSYIDHYTRLEDNVDQHVTTADMQLQNTMSLDERNNFIWGGGARYYNTLFGSTYTIQVAQKQNTHYIFNTFLQDEYAITPDELYLTLGSKFEYYDLSGFQLEPSARLSYHPTPKQTIWGAVSRAMRTPSIYEEGVDFAALTLPGAPPTELRLIGNMRQKSEELIAYELGHRLQPQRNLSFDTALFYNDYHNLQAISTAGAIFPGANGNNIQPYQYNNYGKAHSYGAELAANWNISARWRLAGSYTYTKLVLNTTGPTGVNIKAAERLTPRNQFAIQSYYSLTDDIHWDNMLYYVGALTSAVDPYLRYDSRIAWLAVPGLELSLIGRNLLDPYHPEFPNNPQAEIGRTIIGQVLWKF